MGRQSTPQEALSRELDRVERAFEELGLRAGDAARERARAHAVGADEARTAGLALARELFADAATGPAAEDPGMPVRVIDRLAEELGEPRARVARALLRPEGAAEDAAAETLLALVEAGDRRAARLGFDLHDGPLQELLLLGEDLRMFRGQLASALGEDGPARLLSGRVDDLEARLAALESGLRRVSTAARVSLRLDEPFAAALRELTDAFAARTGIAPAVRLEGDAEAISQSQRIALLSVVGEALNNVREHARGARAVEVSIALGADGASASVRDDGCGFDVESELLGAARRGRIGLAGMHERVRLLGGECVVDSRPGGPTRIALKLPRWEPPPRSAAAAGDG